MPYSVPAGAIRIAHSKQTSVYVHENVVYIVIRNVIYEIPDEDPFYTKHHGDVWCKIEGQSISPYDIASRVDEAQSYCVDDSETTGSNNVISQIINMAEEDPRITWDQQDQVPTWEIPYDVRGLVRLSH